jgi:hypothetical protein
MSKGKQPLTEAEDWGDEWPDPGGDGGAIWRAELERKEKRRPTEYVPPAGIPRGEFPDLYG